METKRNNTMLEWEVEKSSDRISRELCEVLESGVIFERPYNGTIVVNNIYVHRSTDGTHCFVCVPVKGVAIDKAMSPTAEELKQELAKYEARLNQINEQLKQMNQ